MAHTHPITERPVNILLRLEGAAIFGVSLWFYAGLGATWWLYPVLFSIPDLSALGYLINKHVGAWCYNLAHTYLIPMLLAILAALGPADLWVMGVVWLGHIGLDRAVGYGLKSRYGFKMTHISLK
ncbi:DUF4260 domain-containing protein [Aliiroseovarius halocynthiae]|uniref:DUF4260 family protein n=1 Tax=Aliiroseovarius halocynthiae TaxID=985055 RepID=A0A545SW42_9RHOB|nr:DUF4260 domain-containing protein [Aliiroseovarius halocynthiae]TQV69176.1 DUF4260 family protein [Aliiroseovarius halocynthiae]